MGDNGKQNAEAWHGLVIGVDNCCSLLDQSSFVMPSTPTLKTIAGEVILTLIFIDSTQQQEQKQQQRQRQQRRRRQQQQRRRQRLRRQQREALFA